MEWMINFLMPLLIVVIPTLLVYSQLQIQVGLVCGFVIGVVLGIGSNILPLWTAIIAIIAIASIYFIKAKVEEG